MDEEDDLLPEPDNKGVMILSNRGWSRVDTSLWQHALTIIRLDLSYNHLTELPPQIGTMLLLRDLNCSYNKLVSLPPEIGRLKRLRFLVANNNHITTVPQELSQLDALEELILNENAIEDIPSSISRLANLRILRLTNNKLRSLPSSLADIPTLTELDCANNPQLDIVPPRWQGDSEALLFICRLNREHAIRMSELIQANEELVRNSQFLQQDNLILKERFFIAQREAEELAKNVPRSVMRRLEAEKREEQEREFGEDKINQKCVIS